MDGASTNERSGQRLARGCRWLRLDAAVCLLAAASPMSKPLTNAALVLAILLAARDAWLGRLRPRETPLDGALFVWVLASIVSAAASTDPWGSIRDLRNLGHWSAYYLVAWAVAGGMPSRRLAQVWLAAGALCGLQAFAQWSIGYDVLGRDSAVPTGFFGSHLELGHYMVLLLALAIARWSSAAEARSRRGLLAAIVVLGGSLVISQGRGAWLAFAAVTAAWAWLGQSRRALAAVLIVAALQISVLSLRPRGVEAFYRSYVTLEAAASPVSESQVGSNLWRLSMWREGLRGFAERPVSGTGVHTTGRLSRRFQTPFANFGVAHLHSNYFEVLMTRGFFGLAAFWLLLITAARSFVAAFYAASSTSSREASFVGLAAILVHLVHGLTHFTFGSSWIQIGSFIAMGLASGEAMRSGAAPAFRVSRRGLGWTSAALVAAAFAVPWLRSRPETAVLAALGAVALMAWGMRGRTRVFAEALGAAFAFVVVSSFALLGWGGAIPVIAAASSPFVAGLAALRLADGPADFSWELKRAQNIGRGVL